MNERQVKVLIDNQLKNLNWKDSDIVRQGVKTDEQKKLLGRLRPDYVLYKQDSLDPLIVIEAKKPHTNLETAINQGIKYAEKLNTPIVFATDGIFTKSYHVKKKKPLYFNNEEVDDLIQYSIILNYIHSNEYSTLDKNLIKSREELINIFKELNNSFRDAGVRNGMPRIELFCNILFLKIIDELANQENSLIQQIPSWCRWDKIREKKGEELFSFINGQAFDHFKTAYDGDVLSPITGLLKYNILNNVVDKLDNLHLSSTDTDIKGDAFEYFLRNYGGANTDFGEYFTPRHIVKALVKLLNPQFGESVYDPFCGTGGMLINSFKHIHQRMSINDKNEDFLKNKTIFGGEFTEMFRVAKMNMILTGDGHSNIKRQDSYEQKQTGKYDVVITNIPFGKKMKTKYAGKYGYSTKSAEITGVLHCLDALSNNTNARAGILVPEGILFDSSKVYTSLRTQLIEKHSLESVISLPSGVFGKNTGVKSNILIVKKQSNKQKKHVWYFDVKNDGFSLDAKRQKKQGQNDIDTILSEKDLSIEDKDRLEKLGFSILYKDIIKENKYNLLANFYTKQKIIDTEYPIFSLKELEKDKKLQFLRGSGLSKKLLKINGKNECIHYGELYTQYHSYIIDTVVSKTDEEGKILSCKGDILIPATTTADAMGIAIARCVIKRNVIIGGDINIIRVIDTNSILPEYLSILFNYPLKKELAKYAKGANILHLSNKDIQNIEIVLPPLEIQQKIVSKLDSYQNIINGAKKVIDNYTPYFEIKKDWERMTLGNVCQIVRGGSPRPIANYLTNDTKGLNWLKIGDVDKNDKYIKCTKNKIKEEGLKYTRLIKKGEFILSNSMSFGRPYILSIDCCIHDGWLALKNINHLLNKDYLYEILKSPYVYSQFNSYASGSTVKNMNIEIAKKINIPLPSLEIQKKIVNKLEKERQMIEWQKELIIHFEQNIKDSLDLITYCY